MKSLWSKLFSGILLLLVLASCGGPALAENAQAGSADAYPSQFLSGDVYILKSREKIAGNIAGIGTTLIIEEGAVVLGDVSLIASNLEVDGRIAGDVNLFAGTSTLGEKAIVSGSINQILNSIEINPKAVVVGEINNFVLPSSASNLGNNALNLLEWVEPKYWVALQAGRILALMLAALLAIALFKTASFNVIQSIRANKLASWGAGFITLFFVPIISIVLVATICLSPIGLILLAAFWFASIWGWAALSHIIGSQIISWLKLDWSDELTAVFGSAMIGILVSLISVIPCLGFLLNSLIGAIGLGGVLLSRFGRQAA